MKTSKKIHFIDLPDGSDLDSPSDFSLTEVVCFEENGFFGVKCNNEINIPAIYEKVLLLHDGEPASYYYVLVFQNGYRGLLSDDNKILISPIYDRIHSIVKNYVCVSKDGHKGIVQFGDNVLEECIYDDVVLNRSMSFTLYLGVHKWVVNYDAEIPKLSIDDFDGCSYFGPLCPKLPRYNDYLEEHHIENRKFARLYKNGLEGLIMDDGKILIEPKFHKIGSFDYQSDDCPRNIPLAIARTDEGATCIDFHGFFYGVISSKFKTVYKKQSNRYIAKNDLDKWGIIDDKGKIICPFDFDKYISHGIYYKGYYIIFKNNKGMCVVNFQTGELQTAFYDKLAWYGIHDWLFVESNGKHGFMDINENFILPCIYDSYYELCYDGFSIKAPHATLNGVHGMIRDGVFLSDEEQKLLAKADEMHYSDLEDLEWEHEIPTYGRYRGSYAQDEMGYSDDDIDTIFDGDPSAYWNID